MVDLRIDRWTLSSRRTRGPRQSRICRRGCRALAMSRNGLARCHLGRPDRFPKFSGSDMIIRRRSGSGPSCQPPLSRQLSVPRLTCGVYPERKTATWPFVYGSEPCAVHQPCRPPSVRSIAGLISRYCTTGANREPCIDRDRMHVGIPFATIAMQAQTARRRAFRGATKTHLQRSSTASHRIRSAP